MSDMNGGRGPRPVEVAERLERAADRIMEKGWCRNQAVKGDARCVLGAIWYPYDALFSRRFYLKSWYKKTERAAVDTFEDYIADTFNEDFVGFWNDKQTDRRKVVRHLRRCAMLVRQHKLPVSN